MEPTRGAGLVHCHGRVANDNTDADIVALEDAIDGTRNNREVRGGGGEGEVREGGERGR